MLRADRHHLSKIIAGIEGNTSQRQYACDGEKPSRAAHNNRIWLQTVVSHEGPLTFYRLQSFGSVLGLPIALTLTIGADEGCGPSSPRRKRRAGSSVYFRL